MTDSQSAIEWHPLEPFLPDGARVLFLGSFPPPRKRWCMDFFYPNFINDHWRIQGLVFYGDAQHFVDASRKTFRYADIVEHCRRWGIAYFDTATAVRRLAANASDKFLEVVEPTDIRALIARLPCLRVIVTTGEKATETVCQTLGITVAPKVNTYVSVSPIFSGEAGTTSPPSALPGEEGDRGSLELYRLPSSSRAYPLSLAKKAEAYGAMFLRYRNTPRQ